MNHIKSAFVYRIDLPSPEALAGHLDKLRHREILEIESENAGFVPSLENNLVTKFEGGIAFALRYDEKILPSSVVNEETKRRAKEVEDASGRRVTKIERQAIKEQVTIDLLKVSHVRSKTVTSLYHTGSRLLIVPVSSKHLAAVVTSMLVKAVGAAKTTTINISDVKGGLTTRLASYLANFGSSDVFGEFDLSPEVWLKGETGKVTYQIEDFGAADRGLVEALDSGMRVEAVRLGYGPVSFKLTGDFSFKSVRFEEGAEPIAHDDYIAEWKHEAAVQVFALVQAIEALCVLFDYQEEAANDNEAADEAAA